MNKRKLLIIALCAALVILLALAVAFRPVLKDPVTKKNAANFGILLTDLVNAKESPDTVNRANIEEDLQSIRAIDIGDYKVAKSIADNWQKVFLDPNYQFYTYQGGYDAPEIVDAGIPNSRSHAIVVLGYELKNGQMQPELVMRCEAAAALARTLPETIIVCSGGVTGENNTARNTEAGLMKAFLVDNCGIEASRIFIDEAAMTTAENALNTLKILQQQKVHSMTIVTSQYHQSWGQADYNAVAAIYSRQHRYDVEIIGNYSCDVQPSVEIYKTGWKLAAYQIAGILELPDEVIQSMPSPFGKRPEQSESAQEPAAAEAESGVPDYSDIANWAFYESDFEKFADVFLVCPCVDLNDEFNMSLDDDEETMANFLGALNMERGIYDPCARMFSPYYRQSALKVYDLVPEAREPFMQIAYSDVSAAFSWYLENENNGRPVILAGFSQGADMCYRLLQEYFGSEILRQRLVAVYAIGWPCTEEMVSEYPQIVPAASEDDVGTVISFECEASELEETFIMPKGIRAHSINPLNWRTDATPADKSLNSGACFTDYGANIIEEVSGLCGCYVDAERGALKVTDITPEDYPALLPGLPEGSFHIYDYQFFYRNLQQNVQTRLTAWMEKSAEDLANAA